MLTYGKGRAWHFSFRVAVKTNKKNSIRFWSNISLMTESCSCTNIPSSVLTSWHLFLLIKMVKKKWQKRETWTFQNTFASALHGFCLWQSHLVEINEWTGYCMCIWKDLLEMCYYERLLNIYYNHIIIKKKYTVWFKIVAINHSNQHLKFHETSHSKFRFRKYIHKVIYQSAYTNFL